MPVAARRYFNEYDNDDYVPIEEIDTRDIDRQYYRQKQRDGFLIDRKVKAGPARRFVGVEIELAGGKADSMPWILECRRTGHGCVNDGSIQSSPVASVWGPVEITTMPANGRKFLDAMRRLDRAFRASKARTNKSCGTHVHVDARDLGWNGIRTLIEVWRMVERAMFQAVPRSRRNGNSYCEPCGARYWEALTAPLSRYTRDGKRLEVPYKLKLLSNLYGIDLESRNGRRVGAQIKQAMTKYNGARYAALNIHSWLYRGTVEFRLGSGSTHLLKTTYPWAKICRAIVHFASIASTDDLNVVRAAWGSSVPHGSRRALEALLCLTGEGELCAWYADRVVEVDGEGAEPTSPDEPDDGDDNQGDWP